MKSFVAVLTLALATATSAHENVLIPPNGTMGLLRLPTLFGEGPCSRYKPKPVPIFSVRGDGASIGQIRVTKPWTFPKEGGCSGLEVKTVLKDSASEDSLPTLKYAYEAPAGIVLAKIGGWCQLQLRARTAWIHAECEPGFMSVEAVLHDKKLYVLEGALGIARNKPDGPPTRIGAALSGAKSVSVNVIETRSVSGNAWLHVAA